GERGRRAGEESPRPRAPRAARIIWRTLLTAAIAAAGATLARADYPERQITMIVCFPAGGATDIAARLINTLLGDALGKPVVIENRGGAGGNIAIAPAAPPPPPRPPPPLSPCTH